MGDITYVNFKTKQVMETKMYNLSKHEQQLKEIGLLLDQLKKTVIQMDTGEQFDKYVYKVCNSIVLAYRKVHGL